MIKFVPEENKVICEVSLLREKSMHVMCICGHLKDNGALTEREDEKLDTALHKLQAALWDLTLTIKEAQHLSKKLASITTGE